MRKILLRVLIVALILSALPMGALAAKSSTTLVGFMYEGDTISIATKFAKLNNYEIEWISSDERVVSIYEGTIHANAAGRAIIGAKIQAAAAYLGVIVLPKTVNVKVGEVVSLPNGGREKYTSENKAIAAVNQKGQILGVKVGTARVGIAYGKQRMIVTVNVTDGNSWLEGEGTSPDDFQGVVDELLGESGAQQGIEQQGTVQQSAAAQLDCASEATQIVLVEYQSGSEAKLSIHEMQSGTWVELYAGKAYVGRNGIGKTQEGDGKTPSGTYNLCQPFGIKADPGSNMPYTQITKYHYWCGTSGSEYYNQLVDVRKTERMPESTDEYLIKYAGAYDYAMFIDYNSFGEAGLGSCIFLHCKGSENSTNGCIAVSETVMKNIIKWAKPGAKIVIQ